MQCYIAPIITTIIIIICIIITITHMHSPTLRSILDGIMLSSPDMKWAGVLWKRGLLFHFSSDSMDTMGPAVVMIGDDDDGDDW
jgi:hypothetical protein